MGKKFEIFVCYAQEDQDLLKAVKKHLSQLVLEERIAFWSVADILAGQELEEEERKHFDAAQIILLLVSPNFLASEACHKQVKRAMERHEREETLVISLLMRSCDWEYAPFARLLCLPRDKMPVAERKLPGRDGVLTKVAREIRKILDEKLEQALPVAPTPAEDVFPAGRAKTVLLATLGESPVVVTAMFRWLTEEPDKHQVNAVEVLCPAGEAMGCGYRMIESTLQGRCKIEAVPLPFEDVYSEEASHRFLQILASRLNQHQRDGNTVYLSLAGGRKNMSALMALLAPLYPCVQKLYHLLDKNEGKSWNKFLTIDELNKKSDSDQKECMWPSWEQLIPVPIPYDEQQASPEFLARLQMLSAPQLDLLWDLAPEEAEANAYYGPSFIGTPDRQLRLEFTEKAYERYQKILVRDPDRARALRTCFRQMRYSRNLRLVTDEDKSGAHGKFPAKGGEKRCVFHFYKRGEGVEHILFHTEPEDVCARPDGDIQKVIISHLEIGQDGTHISGKDLVKGLVSSQTTRPLPLRNLEEEGESILLVPLGDSPMVATQLYTLLKDDQKCQIRRVVLFAPDPVYRNDIQRSCCLAVKAFAVKSDVNCEDVYLQGYGDIGSEAACREYQKKLEETISKLQAEEPECWIKLAIAGGRKSMAALAMFAAQRTGLGAVYHTLITDKRLSKEIETQQTLDVLESFGESELQRRLFLDAYRREKEDGKFVVFKVPVIPAQSRRVFVAAE